MKTEYIYEFLTLTKSCNYSIAADELFISQPSLSRHIREIEAEMGIELFDRNAKGVQLNDAGKIFHDFAKEFIALDNSYRSQISNYVDTLNGSLNIGSIFAMPQYGITQLLSAWGKENSNIKMRLFEADSHELLSYLRSGSISLAFLREDFPEENQDFQRVQITTDHLVCLVPDSHPLADRASVSLSELKKETFIYYENCPLFRNLFLGAGYVPHTAFEGVKGSNALRLVKQKLGIMLEFRQQIDDSELGNFKIINIEPSITSSISLLYNYGNLSSSGKKFVSFIRSMVEATN